MILYNTITVEVEKIKSVICDKCKKKYEPNDLETQEFHHIKSTGGYSSVFGDGTKIECDLCQHCLHDMIGSICRTEEET